jgi:RNA polymerase sigma-70 factor (ECF subfamily)
VGRERLTILNDILRLLPEDEQDLLRLRNVAELSFTEIAEILKKNEGAIKKRYYRLLARLQSQLEEENEI